MKKNTGPKMRQLRWNTIDGAAHQVAADGTVWGEIDGAHDESHSAILSALFTEKPRVKKGSPAAKQEEAKDKSPAKTKGAQLIDRRRAQNIEIMLRSLPRWCLQDGLANAVCNAMPTLTEPEPEPESEQAEAEASRLQRLSELEPAPSTDALHADSLLSIASQFPTSDEMQMVYRHVAATQSADSEPGSDLGPAEKFVREMSRVRRLESKLAVVVFAQQFETHAVSLAADLKLGTSACAEVRSSDPLKKVLQLVLQLGNALNAGNGRRAAAFQLGSLLRLADTKSVDGKTTLLRVLADVAAKSAADGELCLLGQALPLLVDAHRLHTDEMRAQLNHLLQGVALAQREAAEAATTADLEEEPGGAEATAAFSSRAGVFASHASARCEALKAAMGELDAGVSALSQYFMLDKQPKRKTADDEKAGSMESMLGTIQSFALQLEEAHAQNAAEQAAEDEKQRRQEKRDGATKAQRWGVSHDSLATGVQILSGHDTGIGAGGQVEGAVLAEAMQNRRKTLHDAGGLVGDLTPRAQREAHDALPADVTAALKRTTTPRGENAAELSSRSHSMEAGAPDDEWAAE